MTYLGYTFCLEEEVTQTLSAAFSLEEESSHGCGIAIWHTVEEEI